MHPTRAASEPQIQSLVWLGFVALVLRLAVAIWLPELEVDAHGHFKLAQAFLRDPTNLVVHWVWLPGWHVVLSGGLLLGAGHTSVRVAMALIQTLGPWLLYRIACEPSASRAESEPPVSLAQPDPVLAYNAALFYTVAPLPNVLGTSAQAETLFGLLLLGTTWALLRARGWLAGTLLAAASLFRYEAWGVVAWLGASVARQRGRWRSGLAAFLVAAGAIAAWLCLRRLSGLPWFSFASATKAFVESYRTSAAHPGWLSVLALVFLPILALGPAVLLAIPGLRALRQRIVQVPAGLLTFVAASALGGGLLALPRYFSALTPYACLAMAAGAAKWSARPRAPSEARVVQLVAASLVLLTFAHLAFALSRVIRT
jgi:hypothetical protein